MNDLNTWQKNLNEAIFDCQQIYERYDEGNAREQDLEHTYEFIGRIVMEAIYGHDLIILVQEQPE